MNLAWFEEDFKMLKREHNLGTFGMAKNVDQNFALQSRFLRWCCPEYSLQPITDIFKNSNNHWVAREMVSYIPLSTTIYITALHFTPTQNYPRRNGRQGFFPAHWCISIICLLLQLNVQSGVHITQNKFFSWTTFNLKIFLTLSRCFKISKKSLIFENILFQIT